MNFRERWDGAPQQTRESWHYLLARRRQQLEATSRQQRIELRRLRFELIYHRLVAPLWQRRTFVRLHIWLRARSMT